MKNPTAAMVVIGDEILSGRTRDSNMHFLAGQLAEAGIDLCEVRVVADDEPAIVNAVSALSQSYDHVFTCGGIGPTHDDITADAIAKTFGVGIDVREDAKKILATNYTNGEADLTPARLRMARIPDGASLIDNPVSKAPGFKLHNVMVMAGVPRVFEAMVQSVLPDLVGGTPLKSISVDFPFPESAVAVPLGELATAHKDITLGSYPYNKNGQYGTIIVARSQDEDALSKMKTILDALRKSFEPHS